MLELDKLLEIFNDAKTLEMDMDAAEACNYYRGLNFFNLNSF